MANILEANGSFVVTRLRGPDAAYLSGAARPSGYLPDPIAVAVGPTITGPAGGAVGVNEYWGAAIAMQAAPDLCWVVVGAAWTIKRKMGANGCSDTFLFPIGSITDDNRKPPSFGDGNLFQSGAISGGGTYPNMDIADQQESKSLGFWYPLSPDDTVDGFNSVVLFRNAGGGWTANDFQVDLSGVRYLGFPVNVWGTGALWVPAAGRGS